MHLPKLHKPYWLNNVIKRDDLWHFFPKGDELNIKSALEIFVYVLIILLGWQLFMQFQEVKKRSIDIRVENLLESNLSKFNENDSLGVHIANVSIEIPHTNKTDNKDVGFLHSFYTEHSILNFSENANGSLRETFNFDNYREALNYVNKKYADITFDNSCFLHLLSDNNKYLNYNDLSNDSAYNDIRMIVEYRPQKVFGNNGLYKIFLSKISNYKSYNNRILMDSFYTVLRDSIGEDSMMLIPDRVKEPLNYIEIKADISSLIPMGLLNLLPSNFRNRLILGKKQYPEYKFIDESIIRNDLSVDDSKVLFSTWMSGVNSELPVVHANEIRTYISGTDIVSRPYSLYDISKAEYHISLTTSTIDSINLIINFMGPCTFGRMIPEPDRINMNSIEFTDQWKILEIKENGLNFYVEFEEFERPQHIRLFIIEAVISGLIIILLTFTLIGIYKIINKNRLKQEARQSSRKHKTGLMSRRKKR